MKTFSFYVRGLNWPKATERVESKRPILYNSKRRIITKEKVKNPGCTSKTIRNTSRVKGKDKSGRW